MIPHQTDTIPKTCPMLILSGTECQLFIIWKAWCGATDRSRCKHTCLKNISKEEQLITGGKGKDTFHLNRERNSFRLVGSSLTQKSENTFSPQENRGPLSYLFKKTKVYCVNQTIAFQSRVLFLASGFHEKNCRKMCLVRDHSICRTPVGQKILLHVHPPQSRGK